MSFSSMFLDDLDHRSSSGLQEESFVIGSVCLKKKKEMLTRRDQTFHCEGQTEGGS